MIYDIIRQWYAKCEMREAENSEKGLKADYAHNNNNNNNNDNDYLFI